MRRVAMPFYALVLLTEIVWMGIVPLAPTYAHTFGLSSVQIGALLASAGVATLVVSLPVGVLADRFGSRTIVLASSAIVTASSLGQGLAGGFWSLLLSRAAFGVALGAVWTAGLAWFSETAVNPDSISSLGFPTTVAGVGIVAGPAFAGLLADALNVHAPFLILAVAGAGVTLVLLRTPREGDARQRREPVRRTLAKARRDNVLLGSLLVMTLIGVAGGGVNLLVPLQLRADGLSAGATGLAMSGSAVVFLLSSALIAGRARAVSLRVVAIAALLYGGSMLLAAGDTSAATMIAFVLLRSPFWAALSTLAYPLAALGAVRAAVGRGAVNGLLNLAWGAAGSAGPVMAGALAQAVGRPWVFAALAAACSGVGVSLLAADSTARPLQRELRSAPANPCCEKGRW